MDENMTILTEDEILTDALRKHLAYMGEAKVIEVLIPIAKEAIKRNKNFDLDSEIDLPEGITAIDKNTFVVKHSAPVHEITTWLRLQKFLDEKLLSEMIEKKKKGEL